MTESEIASAGPSPLNPVSLFHQNVPDPFLRDVVRAVLNGWQAADQTCRDQFEEPERHDLFPIQRRAYSESGIRGAAKRHGFSGTPEKNKRKTSSFSRIICNRVILTVSAVRSANEIVRYADFRLTFARSTQMSMFAEAEPVAPDAPLYALLLHGPGFEKDAGGNEIPVTSKPGFVDIVFPAPIAGEENKIEYVGGRIALLARFPDVCGDGGIKTEKIADPMEPKLRRSTRKDANA